MKVEATTKWEQPFSDGFTAYLSPGTKLETLFSQTPAAEFFECKVSEFNGKTDQDYITKNLVPERIYRKDGYLGFSFSLKNGDIGVKIKKLE